MTLACVELTKNKSVQEGSRTNEECYIYPYLDGFPSKDRSTLSPQASVETWSSVLACWEMLELFRVLPNSKIWETWRQALPSIPASLSSSGVSGFTPPHTLTHTPSQASNNRVRPFPHFRWTFSCFLSQWWKANIEANIHRRASRYLESLCTQECYPPFLSQYKAKTFDKLVLYLSPTPFPTPVWSS